MDGLKELTKSKKFWLQIVGIAVMIAEVTYFQGHPQIQEIVMGTLGTFGLGVASQAHADANDDNYKSKKK
tara:strand:- start:245 stop:454 length:210 start_codon:yes stop_codon:yes gene_type:complete